MNFPTLYSRSASREMIQEFRGYNHNLHIGSGEMYDELNLSADRYPVMAPRKPRGLHITAPVTGMIEKDVLCYTSGSSIIIGDKTLDLGLTDERKQLISMGAYIIIMPDKKYINTADLTDFGEIEARFSTQTDTAATFTLCRPDGNDYNPEYIQSSEPTEPVNGTLWIDTSSTPHALKQWSESTAVWVTIATTYVKIKYPNIGKAFEQYDGIEISGMDGVIIDDASGEVVPDTAELQELNGAAIVWDKGDDFLVIVGLLDISHTVRLSMTVSRTMPNMDFVIESNNRLWGCRYGAAENGEIVNEIYASKLGDFKNWKCYMGVSTDSYTVSLGSDGMFTGAINHLGYPLFFKERCLHKVYGAMPSQYQMQTTACRGVQKGSENSLAIVNEVLYYKGEHSICAYDGSLPVEVSSVLGDVHYTEAYAGAHGNKYYVSMKSGAEESLFIYDTEKGIWHKENGRYTHFCSCRDEMYSSDGSSIYSLTGSGTPIEEQVEWMAETGEIGISSPDMKYTARLNIRMSMDIGSSVDVFAEYDSSGEWEKQFSLTGTNLRSFSMPIRPVRCDHMKLRFVGKGDVRIYSITKTKQDGSDISR